MTGKEFDKIFEDAVQERREIMVKKGPDYDNGTDRLSNFKTVAGMVGVDPKVVLAVYAAKHFLAIMNYCGKGRVESESIDSRISDLQNYGDLLRGLIVDMDTEKSVVREYEEQVEADTKKIEDYEQELKSRPKPALVPICEIAAAANDTRIFPPDFEAFLQPLTPTPPTSQLKDIWDNLVNKAKYVS